MPNSVSVCLFFLYFLYFLYSVLHVLCILCDGGGDQGIVDLGLYIPLGWSGCATSSGC